MHGSASEDDCPSSSEYEHNAPGLQVSTTESLKLFQALGSVNISSSRGENLLLTVSSPIDWRCSPNVNMT